MTKSGWVFEAIKNSQGQYECQQARQTAFEQGYAGSDFRADDIDTEHVNQFSGRAEQVFYIDPQLVRAVSPDWAVQAQEIFMQSLHSNSHGVHADYLKQMRAQFDVMHLTLQQQMAQFSQKS